MGTQCVPFYAMSGYIYTHEKHKEILYLYGGSPGDTYSYKKLCGWLKRVKAKNSEAHIDRGSEPCYSWCHFDQENIDTDNNIFSVLHNALDQTEFPAGSIFLHSASLFVKESYDEWFKQTNQHNPINIIYKNHYGEPKFVNKKYKNCSIKQQLRNRHVFCPNRRFSILRGELAKLFNDNDIFKNYSDKMYASFLFYNKDNHAYIKFREQYPEIAEITLEQQLFTTDLETEIISLVTTPSYDYADTETYIDVVTENYAFDMYTAELREKLLHTFSWWNEIYLSEKTTSRFLLRKPFIIIGEQGYLQHLRDLGFKTFGMLFDESYDSEPDPVKRVKYAWEQAQNIMDKYTIEQLHDIYWSPEIQQVLDHNQKIYSNFVHKYQ